MCSIILLLRPGHRWPVLLAANRDEMADRPWQRPGRHWPDRPEVVAGLDELAGGSWLGMNEHGVVAAILNRKATLGPQAGKRSRGELVLEALDHADAVAAAEALAMLNPLAYRPFNMIISDNRDSFWLSHNGDRKAVSVHSIAPGLSMLTAFELDDKTDPRIRRNLPLFQAASIPDPDNGDWSSWETLLGDRVFGVEEEPTGAMCFAQPSGFGTSSGSLIALPSLETVGAIPIWRFAAGPPDTTPFLPLLLTECPPAL